MNQINYQKELDKLIQELEAQGRVPRLLLHSCCAPCSSYVLEYLSNYFSITVFYYNPNIYPPEEFGKRVEEQQRLEGRRLPADTDYAAIPGLRLEAQEKLARIRPGSIGQASRISGVSPADVSVLLIWLSSRGNHAARPAEDPDDSGERSAL